MNTTDWSALRAAMLLDPKVANLNTGSFGPLPRAVFDRVTELRRRLAEEPMDFLVRQAPEQLWQARERLAGFLGGEPRRLVFTANVTAAINLVASSLPLASPGLVLPARELCREARARGVLTAIDGAHAPGFVEVDLAGIGCDFYGGNGHKWLLAPTGAGFLHLGPGSEDRLGPLQVSWGWQPG